MKKLILLLSVLLGGNSSFAQTFGKISGSLLDEKKATMPFANVLLLKAKDSTLVKGGVSDEKGEFLFSQLLAGGEPYNQYVISISSVGYQKFFSPKIVISAENLSVNLSGILMILAEKNLNAVTVSAKKPLIEQQADKLVMNVENSIVSSGNTAMEVLQKAPGVTIDQNDNISLKGKQGILIYLDGKPTYMSQGDLATMLKNMSSEQIEKIEIISNPSARYDAAGKAIINIVTKKSKNFGTNGSISGGLGMSLPPEIPASNVNGVLKNADLGNLLKENLSLNLNNRSGKVNIFGNFNVSDRNSFNSNVIIRNIDKTIYEQYAYRINHSQNFAYKAGLDYFLSKKTIVGFLVNGSIGEYQNPLSKPAVNNAYFKTSEGVLQSSPLTTSSEYRSWKSTTLNLNYKHTFDSTGKELTADFDYSMYNNLNKERGLMTHFFDAKGVEYGTPLNISSSLPNIYDITAAKIDYSNPLPKAKAKLDFGVKSSWVKSDNDLVFYKNGAIDNGRTNHFIYRENINAVYANFNKEFSKKWRFQAGLRMEHTKSEGNSLTLNESRQREYLQLFPSLFVSQTINENNQFGYSYSRRIERPDYESLNPFISFLDPYTYQLGNEFLKPQYTDAFEANYTFKQAFVTSLGYSRTTDFISEYIKNAKDDPITFEKIKKSNAGTDIDPSKITFATKENIPLFENYSLSLSAPIPVAKWWIAQNNFTIFYNRYSGNLLGNNLDFGQTAFNFYTDHNFTLRKDLSLQVSMWYNSKNVYGQILANEQYAIDLGIKKTFWNKKASLKLAVNDIFATGTFSGKIDYAGINLDLKSRWDSRQIRLNFTYNFGKTTVKSARNRSTATEDEQSRVKSGN